MKLRRRILNRRQIKSSEGEFIWELENSYELSPKLSSLDINDSQRMLASRLQLKGRTNRSNSNRDRRES